MHGRLIVACAALTLVGCGGAAAQYRLVTGMPSQAERMKAVVRAWSANLNAGNNAAEARLFSLPALMIQGPYGYRLTTARQVARWHAGLPCSGKIVSIRVRGTFATAVFRLGDRRRSKC